MDKIRVCYFLEDRAQEGFVKALVERVARDEGIRGNLLSHDVRSARHGSRAINEFRNFLRDNEREIATSFDVLIVTIDGNCKGYNERIRQLQQWVKKCEQIMRNRILYAVPDPHIERWYLVDQRAFNEVIGAGSAPEMPPYKCKKGYYKKVLHQALRDAGVGSLLGGPEYGEAIVAHLDFRQLEQQNAGFGHFINDLRRIFRMWRRTV